MDLEALRLAEAFFARKPEALPSVRAFLLGALERWPETEIVTQKSQVGLRDPRPYCALSGAVHQPSDPPGGPGGLRGKPLVLDRRGPALPLRKRIRRPLQNPAKRGNIETDIPGRTARQTDRRSRV